MEIETALDLINAVIYKPGWKITASDHRNRFEGAVKVRIDYPADNTNREHAKEGYDEQIDTYATFPMVVGNCMDDTTVYRRVLEAILKIEEHEAREYFRVLPAYDAPFHPHRIAGMQRWGDPDRDMLFGIA